MRSLYLSLLTSLMLFGQDPSIDRLAPYFPTPALVVERMLSMGDLKAGEKMFDLGSGDGRIVIAAAQKFKADATGIEFDDHLFKQSMDTIKSLGLSGTARIIHGDILKQDYSSADLLTIYLSFESNGRLTPILEKTLKPGSRVISHDFIFPAWKPAKVEEIEDGEGRKHRIYLYRR